MNAKLPANITCRNSSRIAGTHVTSIRKVKSIAALPAMYSERSSGLDR